MMITIASRASRLALWQAESVKQSLQVYYPDWQIEILALRTEGDQRLDRSLALLGGKSLFIKELEYALLSKDADFAVHSLKDMPTTIAQEYQLAAFLSRACPFDAFVSTRFENFHSLPRRATVGTSSLRRQALLRRRFPEIHIKALRGNVETRLKKMDDGDFDAIILAAAGLQRLGLQHRIRCELTAEEFLPAVGQGALVLETLAENTHLISCLQKLNDPVTALAVISERAFAHALGGNCQMPLAAYAHWQGEDFLSLKGFIASSDGQQSINSEVQTFVRNSSQAEGLGLKLAEKIIDQGGEEILTSWQRKI